MEFFLPLGGRGQVVAETGVFVAACAGWYLVVANIMA